MRPTIHTPGVHLAILDKVDVKVSPARGHYMIRLRYRHVNDKVHEASIVQHILWAPPQSIAVPEMGAFIMSRIFSRLPKMAAERNTSFWLRYDIDDAVQFLQAYVGSTFEVTVESRQSPTSHEFFPNLKYAYHIPNTRIGIPPSIPTPPTPTTPKGA